MKHAVLDTNRVGLILRVYARREQDVSDRVSLVLITIDTALKLGVFSRIDVLVWADPSYPSDCGDTAFELKEHIHHYKTKVPVNFHEVKHGDLFCGLLNYGVALQLRDRIGYSLIMSPDASSYLTAENMDNMFITVMNGCRTTGLAINELQDSVLEGRIANTFALWHTVSLMSVGGFDLRAAHAKDRSDTRYLKGHKDGSEVFYPVHGVEEIIPLCRLVDTFGPCIGTVLPQEDQRYIVPNPIKDPEGYARHIAKMGTKLQRQTALAAAAGYELSFLQGGIKVGELTSR